MFASCLLAAVMGWGPFAPPPRPEPACSAPAACVCVCEAPVRIGVRRAPEVTEPVPEPPPLVEHRRYSAPIVVVDMLSVGMMLAAMAAKNEGLLLLGGMGYSLGAPINHLTNGRPGRALASFGLRAAALGLATGAIIEDILYHRCDGDVNPCGAPIAGIFAGAMIAIGAAAIDDAFLARVPVEPTAARARLAPGLAVGRNLAVLSFAGRF
jgi:hypothetical protein